MPGKVKWLWSINSGSNVDTSNLVTLDGTQTITGSKTFSSAIFTNGGISTSGSNIDFNSKRLSSVATPTANTDAANKQYVDNAITNRNWVTIVNITSNISSLTDNFTQIIDYTSFSNFSMGSGNTYEVMFKCNVDSTDIYCSGITASNSTSYDNIGFTNTMYWGDSSGIIFKFSLNNNRIKIWAKRNGSNTNWNTGTRVYIRKIMNGGIQ